VKQRNNVQVNGNVYGGIHFNGGCQPCTPHADSGPQATASGIWFAGKVLAVATAIVVGVPIALAGGLLLLCFALVFLLAGLSLDIAIWTLCRGTTALAIVLLRVEDAIGGGPKRLVFTPSIWGAARSLGPGNTDRELTALAKREPDYVDSN
jgi:hypothetical protein